MATLVRFVGS